MDRLWKLGFEFRKSRLWTKLREDQVFAVSLPDGGRVWCSVMGAMGFHVALAAFVGDEAFGGWMRMSATDPDGTPVADMQRLFLSQDCIQCEVAGREDAGPVELEQVRDAAKRLGIRLRSDSRIPRFVRRRPFLVPWRLEEGDADVLALCLEAALEVGRRGVTDGRKWLGKAFPSVRPSMDAETGIVSLEDGHASVPLLTRTEDGGFTWDSVAVPVPEAQPVPRPDLEDDETLGRLRSIVGEGCWECEVATAMQPVTDVDGGADQIPYFPTMMVACDCATGLMAPVDPVRNYPGDPDSLLRNLARAALEVGRFPGRIRVRGEYTFQCLSRLCGRLGVGLEKVQDLPAVDEAMGGFQSVLFAAGRQGGEDDGFSIDGLVQLLSSTDVEGLKAYPRELLEEFRPFMGRGIFPPEVEEKLAKVLSEGGRNSPS